MEGSNKSTQNLRDHGGYYEENDAIRLMKKLYYECKVRMREFNPAIFNGSSNENHPIQCPVVFDGHLCWGPTEANSTEYRNCPSYVIDTFDSNLMASKFCLPNGTWFRRMEDGNLREWSNYTTCINQPYFDSVQLINNIYFYGYCASLFTLIASLIIFLSFSSLRCTRIRIHIQLFTSLALTCLSWLSWYKLVVGSADVIGENPQWCIMLHIIIQYLMLCNYFWMFCEGVHLHLVLVVVFVKDAVAMKVFRLIGWILPMIFVAAYSFTRKQNEEDSKMCWIDESHYQLILVIPVIIVLLCSLIFLINIVRVLITKLHPRSTSPAPTAIKKAVRATLILIPLFGLQHILFPLRPEKGSAHEFAYQILSAVSISLQGCIVSVLFCFANHEVISAVKIYFNSICPWLFKNQNPETYIVAPSTTKDIMV